LLYFHFSLDTEEGEAEKHNRLNYRQFQQSCGNLPYSRSLPRPDFEILRLPESGNYHQTETMKR